jgi:hypothetical protein
MASTTNRNSNKEPVKLEPEVMTGPNAEDTAVAHRYLAADVPSIEVEDWEQDDDDDIFVDVPEYQGDSHSIGDRSMHSTGHQFEEHTDEFNRVDKLAGTHLETKFHEDI